MDRIYHGRMTKNTDWTNQLIGPYPEKCLVSTATPFWKYSEDIPNIGVKAGAQYKKQATVSNRAFNTYFRTKTKKVLNDGKQPPTQRFTL